MNEKIKSHVESLFAQAPNSRRANELKDELISNLTDRYNDFLAQGQDEETAYKATIAGIGDVDELLRGLRDYEIFDPVQIQIQRQKSALLVSIAVALYIISLIFPIMFGGMSGDIETMPGILGMVLMFVCWAIATMLLVYNGISKPKYVKMDDTIVEEFKEWKTGKSKSDALFKSISSMIWMLAVVTYLMMGFFANLWHPGWLIFLLPPIIMQILKLISVYKGDN